MQLSVHRHCAAVALVVACLGGQAVAGPVGPVETFEGDTVGSFPAGWSDFAVVDPTNTAPKPSDAAVSTTDRFGGLLWPKQTLAKSNQYYHSIHPVEAAETDERRAHELAEVQAKAAAKVAQSPAPAASQ